MFVLGVDVGEVLVGLRGGGGGGGGVLRVALEELEEAGLGHGGGDVAEYLLDGGEGGDVAEYLLDGGEGGVRGSTGMAGEGSGRV